MWILGISELDNDAGAALFDGPDLVAAANEERFSRRKRHRGVPVLAVRWLLQEAGIGSAELDRVVVAKPPWPRELRSNNRHLLGHPYWTGGAIPLRERLFTAAAIYGWRFPRNTIDIIDLHGQLRRWLKAEGIPDHKVLRVDHHRAHAACAWYGSGWDEGLVLTCDGQGGGVSAAVYRGRGAKLECLHRVRVPHSLGLFYGAATKALGYKPGRHEGKVTGLAAYDPPDEEALGLCRDLVRANGRTFSAPHIYGTYPRMKRILERCGPGPFAAAFQVVLEQTLESFAAHWVEQTGASRVGLAGGVFANVKLNQRIHQLPGVESVFVFPHMADGGLGWGAALDHWCTRERRLPAPVKDVYWGPEYSEPEMRAALERAGLSWRRPDHPEEEIASLLVEGKVVGRFGGRMEFGPRALGNRSILYKPTDPSVNDWLNKALHRTEFMPFAPVTLIEQASRCYLGLEGAERAAEFMTVTFDCTPSMCEQAPAVVHVDGTARPQLLRRETNPFYYDIVDHYHRKTGIPSIVNTSFNMHEEPIVCSPDDAVRAFTLGHLDALSLGPYLCTAPEGKAA